ncbi:MAG TPA: ATP-binding protein [Dissulfurispiraceae bacterium]|nr:ATP-binding protein [Dissulfurispiraceae bacterium]
MPEATDKHDAAELGEERLLDRFLHPLRTIAAIRRDHYRSSKYRLFFMVGTLAGIPLLGVVMIGLFWLHGILEEDFNNQLKWQLDITESSIEFFLQERISGLRYLVSVYSFNQLSNQGSLSGIFQKRQKEFSELVDLGVIDSRGIQLAYAGPYDLKGKDYSQQEWFHETKVRGIYVSDVFTGYRKIPHFSIAIRQDIPGSANFWIIRATINMDTLNRFVSRVKLKENDDAFIINEEGVLQTPSRFHGRFLEKLDLKVPLPQQSAGHISYDDSRVGQITLGYTRIKNSPWILTAMIKPTAYWRIVDILRKDILAVYLIGILVLIGIMMNYRMVNNWVDRIKQLDQEREQAISETEHSAKLALIGRLAAGIAHEINNPLAIINEKAGLMQDVLNYSKESNPCKEKFLPLISVIADSVNRCRTITHRLLGFARRMDIHIESIDINELLKEVVGFLEREIMYRNIKLEFNFNEHLRPIESDRGLLQQVFLNIANNAIDAVDDGGTIEIATVSSETYALAVHIRDNGRGISKEVMKHIFEPFYTTKEKGKGTGLGLSLSYGIIQRLGGTIEVDSVRDKGTTFTIKLPYKAELKGGAL